MHFLNSICEIVNTCPMFTLYIHLFSSRVCMLHVCACVGIYMYMGVPAHIRLCVLHVYLCGCICTCVLMCICVCV